MSHIVAKTKEATHLRIARGIIVVLTLALIVSVIGNIYLLRHQGDISKSANLPLHSSERVAYEGGQNPQSDIDILFIGNSITLHPRCDYWWGEWGMAASEKDRDYAHLTTKALASIANVNLKTMNFGAWELQANDRAETLPTLDPFLDKGLEYVVIQLGENVTNASTLESDFYELVKYIRASAPSASIYIIGMYWESPEKDADKRQACEKAQASFVDLADIQDEKYYCGINTKVMGDDKQEHIVEHKGVAKHPGDEGMTAIADHLLNAMGFASDIAYRKEAA